MTTETTANLSPKDRLEIARQEYSGIIRNPDPGSVQMLIPKLAVIQSILYALKENPEATFRELSVLSQLALDKARDAGNSAIQEALQALQTEYETTHKSFLPAPSTRPTPQPTRTEALPPMRRPKTDQNTASSVRTATQEATDIAQKPLTARLQQVYDLIASAEDFVTEEELAKKLGVQVQSVQPYLSQLRSSGREVERVRDAQTGNLLGLRINKPSEIGTTQSPSQ